MNPFHFLNCFFQFDFSEMILKRDRPKMKQCKLPKNINLVMKYIKDYIKNILHKNVILNFNSVRNKLNYNLYV